MDNSSHGGGMGGMSTGAGVPNNFYIQKTYWAVVGAALALATAVNVLNKILAWQRYFTFPPHLKQLLTSLEDIVPKKPNPSLYSGQYLPQRLQ